MAATTTVLPAGLVAAASTAYDINKEEIDAMRRYVPAWSKNSTLIPFKDKEGNLEYIDFSHMNAYDTLVRPIQTVINAVNEGQQDKDGIIGRFLFRFNRIYKRIRCTIYYRIYVDRSFTKMYLQF